MKQYYFLLGQEQHGPFTIDQLIEKNLTGDTLIWAEGMESWIQLKNEPELVSTLKPKVLPPPPPKNVGDKLPQTHVTGHLKITTNKEPNRISEVLKPSDTVLMRLVAWCGFHLFALLMSYSKIEIFNNGSDPETGKFWPFVEFISTFSYPKYNDLTHKDDYVTKTYFQGFFTEYDWTEFLFYVVGAIILYLLISFSNKSEEANTTFSK